MGSLFRSISVSFAFVAVIAAVTMIGPVRAQEQQTEPIDVGTTERTTVRLVLVDVVVLDRQDRTVPDLTAEDFEVFALGKPVDVDTVDLDCPVGVAEEPLPMRKADAHDALPGPSGGRRKTPRSPAVRPVTGGNRWRPVRLKARTRTASGRQGTTRNTWSQVSRGGACPDPHGSPTARKAWEVLPGGAPSAASRGT